MHNAGDSEAQSGIMDRIRACCLAKGMNVGELARRAGLSRTTLYQIARGATRRPRPSTLSRIARALGVAPERLLDSSPPFLPPELVGSDGGEREARQRFDRCTNTVISAVYRARPRLFRGWSRAEWEELYSTFGTGGELNEQGVVQLAEKMNRRRETVHKLEVLLETHLSEVAENLLETLYQMVTPQGNLQATPELTSLLAEHQRQKRRGGASGMEQ